MIPPAETPSPEPATPIPSATVALARQVNRLEVLLLRRNTQLFFAPGMWVFPGGRIDPEDYPTSTAVEGDERRCAAQRAACREAFEEAGIAVEPQSLTYIDHYVTPHEQPRRFSTWFFLAEVAADQPVVIDRGEIVEFCWLTAEQALQRHQAGDFPLVRPTREVLTRLTGVESAIEAKMALGRSFPE